MEHPILGVLGGFPTTTKTSCFWTDPKSSDFGPTQNRDLDLAIAKMTSI